MSRIYICPNVEEVKVLLLALDRLLNVPPYVSEESKPIINKLIAEIEEEAEQNQLDLK